MMATYRPHNNQLMEWVQTRERMRSNKAMVGSNNLSRIEVMSVFEPRSCACLLTSYGRLATDFNDGYLSSS
uniref:LpxL/LpxP family acyltransferase n=1 Tax=Salmonella enterica TaxID=28901 RepID=UPI003C6E8108